MTSAGRATSCGNGQSGATPRSISVGPGNGGSIDCGWATSRTEDGVKKYLKTARGQAAFEASATLPYDVTFTMNGGPLPAADLARLPDSLDSPAEAAAVPVDEVQVIVE